MLSLVAVLSNLPELVQRAQIIRPWFIFVGLGPIGPRYLANIKIAAAVNREAMRG